MSRRLGTVVPREQVGPRTGAQYEFQYGEAALACLELLAQGTDACVYCEWHDDYVVERSGGQPTYEFFQVKARSNKAGPWPMSEILGVVGKRPRIDVKQTAPAVARNPTKKKTVKSKPRKPLKPTVDVGIAERLLEHQRNFPGACAAFAFVSTHEATDDAFLALLTAAAAVRSQPRAGPSMLDPEAQALFAELLAAYQARDSTITSQDVWDLITRLRIENARGRPGQADVVIGLIGQRIYDLSEVDLQTTEQRRVAADLIARVRAKSHLVLPVQPLPSEDEIRSSKAIAIDEVLSLLALSPSGYRELINGGSANVREYSRLHRLCKASGMDGPMIAAACRLRVNWLKWLSEHRDTLTDDVIMEVRGRTKPLLDQLRNGMPTADLRTAAEATAGAFDAVRGLPHLDAQTVMGLVFAMASEEPSG
ncbi:MAG: DUF4297 domain-containing protein [Sandaracinaceae bacterium]|nr:DUF4297 domain-containing protein [Sandaracinaceae bacterium]